MDGLNIAAVDGRIQASPPDMAWCILVVDRDAVFRDGFTESGHAQRLAALLRTIRASGVPCVVLADANTNEPAVREANAERREAGSAGHGELAAHLHEVLHGNAREERDRASSWRFDVPGRELFTPDGARAPLTTAECDLLAELVAHRGVAQTREALSRKIFGRAWQPSDRALDTIIVKLRRKFEPDPDHPRVIKTIRGKGYVFTGFPNAYP